MNKVTDTIYYVGCNDHDIDLFEGHYIVPNGIAYNSYVINDDKVVIMDTVDQRKTQEWLDNVKEVLGDKTPDYLVVQHMEPDHSASIDALLEVYPDTTVVGNDKTFKMIGQFFPGLELKNTLSVKEGDTLETGHHTLTFVFAPMVHWPEVMFTYDAVDKVLFSADGFGKFGALDVEEDWACEARRYYFGIVGKYGQMVQAVLKKAAGLDIQTICPLHGPVLKENLGYYLDLYNTWSSYGVETKGVCLAYTSVYGNTKKAVEYLASKLEEAGVPKVAVTDLAREDMAEAVEDAFRYDTLICATTTFNMGIFPFMREFIESLMERNYQNKRIAYIENGTWAPNAKKVMMGMFEGAKNMTTLENNVTILSAMTDENKAQLDALALEVAAAYK